MTGVYRHYANNIIDLQVSSESRSIATTDNHPFWSEDRQQFVPAGDLQPGEHLRLRSGATSVVESIGKTKRSAPVFNIEVDGEHVYYVGLNGALVHNTGEEMKGSVSRLRLRNVDVKLAGGH